MTFVFNNCEVREQFMILRNEKLRDLHSVMISRNL